MWAMEGVATCLRTSAGQLEGIQVNCSHHTIEGREFPSCREACSAKALLQAKCRLAVAGRKAEAQFMQRPAVHGRASAFSRLRSVSGSRLQDDFYHPVGRVHLILARWIWI